MMYFSRLKTALILGVCCSARFSAFRTCSQPRRLGCRGGRCISGLDLRGGSYLLLEVDMKAVIKERLDSMVDAVRQALRPGTIFYQSARGAARPEPGAAPAARPRAHWRRRWRRSGRSIAAESATGTPDFDLASSPDGTIMLTLSPVALNARATRRRPAVDRDRPPPHRRDRRGRPADHPAGHRPHRGAAARHRGPEPDQGTAGQDRAHDVPARGRDREPRRRAARRRPGSTTCRCRTTRARSSRCAAGWTWTAAT